MIYNPCLRADEITGSFSSLAHFFKPGEMGIVAWVGRVVLIIKRGKPTFGRFRGFPFPGKKTRRAFNRPAFPSRFYVSCAQTRSRHLKSRRKSEKVKEKEGGRKVWILRCSGHQPRIRSKAKFHNVLQLSRVFRIYGFADIRRLTGNYELNYKL